MENKLLALLKSRKFWAALVGLLLIVLRTVVPNFPLSDDQIQTIVWLLVAYITGVAVEDGLSRKA